MAQLKLEGLSKRFDKGRAAVDNVSLTLREGGFLALLGPSGCGKTTILRMIAGFEAPSEGEIRLGERLMSSPSLVLPPEARNMAMVFQSYALWPHMTVAENVGYPLKVRGAGSVERGERVSRALHAVRLETLAGRKPSELSGGQRQRVALARCLVSDPDVVLLDEPLANLDRHLRQEMEETFRDFHQTTGATMVYVTHDQAEAMALATDVAVMAEGRLLQMATPETLYDRPEGRLVGSLIGRSGILALHDDGRADRHYDSARFLAALRDRPAAAPLVDVLVRPQDVVLLEPNADGTGLTAEIQSIAFEGERYALTVSLPDGQEIKAFSRHKAQKGDLLSVKITAGWRL